MIVKRKDFQKTAGYIHEFLLKLHYDWESAELRDALNYALLHMQKYYCILQTRIKKNKLDGTNSSGYSIGSSGLFNSQSLQGLSPMTPCNECPDKWELNWVNLENSRTTQKMFRSLNIPANQGTMSVLIPIILEDCKRGDLDAIEQRWKTDSNCLAEVDSIGRTPIIYAVHHLQNHVVKWLLEHKQDPNARAHDNSTALHHACSLGNEVATEILLQSGADPHLTDSYERAPIHLAVTTASTNCLKLLLKYQTSVDLSDQDGMTPYMWACRLDHLDHLQILCQDNITILNNDDRLQRDHSGKSCIHWSVRRTTPLNCLKTLLDKNSAHFKDEDGKTPLLLASELGSLPACKLIIEVIGVEIIDQLDNQERSPLHLATIGGHGEVVNFLLEKGSDINRKDNSMSTPWDYARNRQLHYCSLIISSHYRQRNKETESREFTSLNSSLSTRGSNAPYNQVQQAFDHIHKPIAHSSPQLTHSTTQTDHHIDSTPKLSPLIDESMVGGPSQMKDSKHNESSSDGRHSSSSSDKIEVTSNRSNRQLFSKSISKSFKRQEAESRDSSESCKDEPITTLPATITKKDDFIQPKFRAKMSIINLSTSEQENPPLQEDIVIIESPDDDDVNKSVNMAFLKKIDSESSSSKSCPYQEDENSQVDNQEDLDHKPPRPPTTPPSKSPTLRRSLKVSNATSLSMDSNNPEKLKDKDFMTETTVFDRKESEDLEFIPDAYNSDPLSLSGRNTTLHTTRSEPEAPPTRDIQAPSREEFGRPPKTARGRPSSNRKEVEVINSEVERAHVPTPNGADLRFASQVPQLDYRKPVHLQRTQPPPMLHSQKHPNNGSHLLQNDNLTDSRHNYNQKGLSSQENKINCDSQADKEDFDRLSPPPKPPLTPPETKKKQRLPPQLIPLSMSGNNRMISTTKKYSGSKKRKKRENDNDNDDLFKAKSLPKTNGQNNETFDENARVSIRPLQPPGLHHISDDRADSTVLAELKMISPRSLPAPIEQTHFPSPRTPELIPPPRGFRNNSAGSDNSPRQQNNLLSPRALGSLNTLPSTNHASVSNKRSKSETRNFGSQPVSDKSSPFPQAHSGSTTFQTLTNQSLYQRR